HAPHHDAHSFPTRRSSDLDVDAVVNLAGTPIRPRPFTAGYKQQLLDSRVDATTTLSEGLAAAAAADPGRPRVLLNASAVGYYGEDRKSTRLNSSHDQISYA